MAQSGYNRGVYILAPTMGRIGRIGDILSFMVSAHHQIGVESDIHTRTPHGAVWGFRFLVVSQIAVDNRAVRLLNVFLGFFGPRVCWEM